MFDYGIYAVEILSKFTNKNKEFKTTRKKTLPTKDLHTNTFPLAYIVPTSTPQTKDLSRNKKKRKSPRTFHMPSSTWHHCRGHMNKQWESVELCTRTSGEMPRIRGTRESLAELRKLG